MVPLQSHWRQVRRLPSRMVAPRAKQTDTLIRGLWKSQSVSILRIYPAVRPAIIGQAGKTNAFHIRNADENASR